MTIAMQPPEVVRAFYAAVGGRDGAALDRLLNDCFREDAAVVFPESLPYGGRVEGVRRLQRMFGALAGETVSVGPVALHLDEVIAQGDRVAALLSFDWQPPSGVPPIASSASEIWSFRAGKVAEIAAFYWDTAALVGAS